MASRGRAAVACQPQRIHGRVLRTARYGQHEMDSTIRTATAGVLRSSFSINSGKAQPHHHSQHHTGRFRSIQPAKRTSASDLTPPFSSITFPRLDSKPAALSTNDKCRNARNSALRVSPRHESCTKSVRLHPDKTSVQTGYDSSDGSRTGLGSETPRERKIAGAPSDFRVVEWHLTQKRVNRLLRLFHFSTFRESRSRGFAEPGK